MAEITHIREIRFKNGYIRGYIEGTQAGTGYKRVQERGYKRVQEGTQKRIHKKEGTRRRVHERGYIRKRVHETHENWSVEGPSDYQ